MTPMLNRTNAKQAGLYCRVSTTPMAFYEDEWIEASQSAGCNTERGHLLPRREEDPGQNSRCLGSLPGLPESGECNRVKPSTSLSFLYSCYAFEPLLCAQFSVSDSYL